MDTLTKHKRSRLMARITGNNLKPETAMHVAITKELQRRKRDGCVVIARNVADLPGTPDIVLARVPRKRTLGLLSLFDQQVAVFVHGCFWHGCPRHHRMPKTRRTFWRRKLDQNQRRDGRARRKLRRLGFMTAVVWEHDVKRHADRRAKSLVARILGPEVANG